MNGRSPDDKQQAGPLAGQSAAERAARHRRLADLAAQCRGDAALIAVSWDPRLHRPVAFLWRGRRFRIERVVRQWVIATGWWSQEIEVNRHYWRVRAEGRLFDISFDRLAKLWRLD